jgi:hypothetical protein
MKNDTRSTDATSPADPTTWMVGTIALAGAVISA